MYKIIYMNWPIIIIVIVLAVVLIAFLIKRNLKDEKDFEETIAHEPNTHINHEKDIESEK